MTTLTDSKIAQETYRKRLYKKRCGTCRHSQYACYAQPVYFCDHIPAGEVVDVYGYCELWKEKES